MNSRKYLILAILPLLFTSCATEKEASFSIPQKEKLILSVQELFNIYLGEKKWVKCLKCLRVLKQELPRKVYDEYHQMMLYVTKSLGVMKYHYKAKEIV